MARFAFEAFPRALDAKGNPVSGGLLYVFDGGTTTPATTYSNEALTTAHAHPIVADAEGFFPAIYASSGLYKVRVSDADGAQLQEVDWVNNDGGFRLEKDTVSDILSDTDWGYSGSNRILAVGDIVTTRVGRHAYKVLAQSASDYDIITAGGVKLSLQDMVVCASAFGAKGTGAQNTVLWQAALDRCLSDGRPFFEVGEWDIDGPLTIEYSDTLINHGAKAVVDFSATQITHTGSGYLWSLLEAGNNAARNKIEFRCGRMRLASGGTVPGCIKINCWGGLEFKSPEFIEYPTGTKIVHIINDITGDYSENIKFSRVRSVNGALSNGGSIFYFEVGAGTSSFARFELDGLFIGGTHDYGFYTAGGVYNADIHNVVGNPGATIIFSLGGAMGGTKISKIGLEQTSAAGVCFDVSRGFSGVPPKIDFTGFAYGGSGAIWDFGATGLTEQDFGGGHAAMLRTRSGIQFPATPVVSSDPNNMDAYQEFQGMTPVYATSGTAISAITYDNDTVAKWTRVGNLIFFSITLKTDSVTLGSASGNLIVDGLPIAAATSSAGAFRQPLSIRSNGFASNGPQSGFVEEGTTKIFLYNAVTGGGACVPSDLSTGANANTLFIGGHYQI